MTVSIDITPTHRWNKGRGNVCWSSCKKVGEMPDGTGLWRCSRGHIFKGRLREDEAGSRRPSTSAGAPHARDRPGPGEGLDGSPSP